MQFLPISVLKVGLILSKKESWSWNFQNWWCHFNGTGATIKHFMLKHLIHEFLFCSIYLMKLDNHQTSHRVKLMRSFFKIDWVTWCYQHIGIVMGKNPNLYHPFLLGKKSLDSNKKNGFCWKTYLLFDVKESAIKILACALSISGPAFSSHSLGCL